MDLASMPTRTKSVPCSTCTLPRDLRQILEADRASVAPHSYMQLARFLQAKGITLSAAAIQAHFRKGHAQ